MSVLVPTVERMRELAGRVAAACGPGDLIILSGELGAGKTTFVQGLARAMGVEDPVTSPTFVIARTYRGTECALVHVDAYRVGSALELDDLDLDADVESSVTVVEWGAGKVEQLAADRLLVTIDRSDGPDDERRIVTFTGSGARWTPEVLSALDAPW